MPSHCCVPLCRSKARGHQFPSDPAQKKKWLMAMRMDIKFEPTEKAIVCFEHFSQEQYATVNANGHKPMRKWLKKDAVPWKFEWTSLAAVYERLQPCELCGMKIMASDLTSVRCHHREHHAGWAIECVECTCGERFKDVDADCTRHFECPDKGWENDQPSNTAASSPPSQRATNEAMARPSSHRHHPRFTYRKEKKDDDDDDDDRVDADGHHEATKQDPSTHPDHVSTLDDPNPSRCRPIKPMTSAPIRTLNLDLEGYPNSRPRTSVLFQLRHVYCTTCQCRFASAGALAQHLVVHGIFVCLVCGKEMDSDLRFRDHQNVQCSRDELTGGPLPCSNGGPNPGRKKKTKRKR